MCRRLRRLPRHDDRQHRFPRHLALVLGLGTGRPLLGIGRLFRRHRGAVGPGRWSRRSLRAQADLSARRDRFHRGQPALRDGAQSSPADRLPHPAGGRRCADCPNLVGDRPRQLPDREALDRRRSLGRCRGGRGGNGTDPRRRPGRALRLAARLPRQPAARRRDPACWTTQPARAEGRRQPSSRPSRGADAGLVPGADHAGDRRGQRLGLDRPRHARLLRRRSGVARRNDRAQPQPPAPDRLTRAFRPPFLPDRQHRHPALRRRLLLVDPRQRRLPHLDLGLHRAPGRRRDLARTGDDDDRLRPGRATRRPLRPSRRGRPGGTVLRRRSDGAALGRSRARLVGSLAPGRSPHRHRHRARLPDSRLGRRPRHSRRPLRHRERRQRCLPPGRRRARHRDPGRDRR